MKTFSGHRSYDEIKRLCEQQKVWLQDRLYKDGYDYIVIGKIDDGQVCYNVFTGSFFGTHPDGFTFESAKTTYENSTWFQSLLSFFYIEK
jgi:hypothetical protein